MNAPTLLDSPLAAASDDAGATRLREIPYNYTSFSDREIVIRLLGEEAWRAAGRTARQAPDRPFGAHAVRGAGRHLGGAAQSLPAGRPAGQSEAAPGADRCPAPPPGAKSTSGAASRSGDSGDATARTARSASVETLLRAAKQAIADFSQEFRQTYDLRKRATKLLGRHTRRDNIQFDGLSRVSHVTDATDWRVEYPFVVLTPDTEDEMAGAGAGLHRTRPDHHPARRRHRLHRRRGAADAAVGGDQHRKAGQRWAQSK